MLNLAGEMLNVVTDLMMSNDNVREIFIKAIRDKRIYLKNEDFENIKSTYSDIFEQTL